MVPTSQALFSFARSIQGEELATSHRKKPFKVAVVGNTLEFTPGSSVHARSESLAQVETLLTMFGKTGSWQPEQYKGASFNASYVLALFRRWQDAQALAPVRP